MTNIEKRGVTVDANVMKIFAGSNLRNEENTSRTLIHMIQNSIELALSIDSGGKIERQWLDTCGDLLFREWYYQGFKDGYIRKFAAKLAQGHKKNLRTKCGFPSDRFEITYIAVANVTKRRYVVTEDIHFFDPRLKRANQQAKARARTLRNGPVCRYLKQKLKIRVGTPDQGIQELF